MYRNSKILYIIISLISLVFISGCDFCNSGPGDYVMEESDIYFTSSAVNSPITGIFRINQEGKNIRSIVPNAEIYSEPSGSKKIVYTSFVAPGAKFIYRSNIDGTNPEVIQKEEFSNNKLYPIISYDGKHIVVNDVDRGLWLIRQDNSFLKLSSNFCMNTMPSFSPDGTKLAYYEGGFLYNPLTVVILDMEQEPPVEIARKIHSTGLEKYTGDATIGWSKDGQKICYIITKSTALDYIYIGDYNSPNDAGYEITSIGAYQPSLNMDMSKVVFAGRDGNLWIRNLKDTSKSYIKVTSSGQVSMSLYPMWSQDDSKILYIKQFKDEDDIMSGSLEIIELKEEVPVSKVISNNVLRGFWNRR